MDQRLEAAIAFMKINLQRRLTPAEIARTVNLSPSRVRQLFRKETGMSLGRYLRQLRMERAKQLLETSFLSVKGVASTVGINGVSHFVRDFEKAYHLSPARYAGANRRSYHHL
jgi:two-component system response regulator YesN